MLETDLEATNRLFDEAVRGLVNAAFDTLPTIKTRIPQGESDFEIYRMSAERNAVPIARIERAMEALLEAPVLYGHDGPRDRLYYHLVSKSLEAKGIVRER